MENNLNPVAAPNPQVVYKGGSMKKRMMMFLVAIILLGIGAGAGWMWRDKDAKALDKAQQSQISTLDAQITSLQKELADAKSAATTKTTTTGVRPSAAVLTSIQDSIKSGNTVALVGYMAPSVKVIIAASSGVGDRTPTQAISDLKYLDAGTAPWDFALSAATITKYQAGSYKQYFPTTALVGKSANNYVVSFQFDSGAKISGIFMAADASLLQ